MNTKLFTYWAVEPPAKWQAGAVGSPPNQKPIYFDCAGCGQREPEIGGILSTDGTFNGIALLGKFPGFIKAAMFCQTCFAKRITTTTQVPKVLQ